MSVPAQAKVIAAYPGCPVGALGYGHRALSLQWHPEYPADYMAAILAEEGPDSLPEPMFRAATASLGPVDHGARAAWAAVLALGWR